MESIIHDSAIIIQIAGFLISVGIMLAQVQSLKKDVSNLQETVEDRLTDGLHSLTVTVAALRATCQARHIERHNDDT